MGIDQERAVRASPRAECGRPFSSSLASAGGNSMLCSRAGFVGGNGGGCQRAKPETSVGMAQSCGGRTGRAQE